MHVQGRRLAASRSFVAHRWCSFGQGAKDFDFLFNPCTIWWVLWRKGWLFGVHALQRFTGCRRSRPFPQLAWWVKHLVCSRPFHNRGSHCVLAGLFGWCLRVYHRNHRYGVGLENGTHSGLPSFSKTSAAHKRRAVLLQARSRMVIVRFHIKVCSKNFGFGGARTPARRNCSTRRKRCLGKPRIG
jgi:hypothetical protein